MPAKGLHRRSSPWDKLYQRGHGMEKSESYIYEIGKMKFIVEPVYKDKGETIKDILLKLMLAELGLD